MPSDLTIRPFPAPYPVEAQTPASTKEIPVGAALTAVVPVSIALALNPESGVVVIEFRNDAGKIIGSIPTAQQLAAYRDGSPARTPSRAGPAVPADATDPSGGSDPLARGSRDSKGR